MFDACRAGMIVGAVALLSACTSGGGGGAGLDTGAPRPVALPGSADPEGAIPRYCPQVSLREGTAILRKGAGDELQYVASIVSTSRECHIVDGELRMKVGVSGRVVPGPGLKPGAVALPIRVAVVRGGDVLYTAQGSQSVELQPAQGVNQFVYVDQAVAVPEPTARNLVIYAGFDEGPGR